MFCSDSRSFKIKYPDFVAKTLQVRTNVVSGNSQDSRYVLTDNPTRRKLSDNSEHFRPQVTVVPFTFLLSSHGKWLAWETSGNDSWSVNSSSSPKIVSCEITYVPPSRHIRPMFLKYFRRVVRPLALSDRLESGPFGGKIEATDAGEK